VCTKAK